MPLSNLPGSNGEPVAQVMCHSYSFCLVTLSAIDTERLGGKYVPRGAHDLRAEGKAKLMISDPRTAPTVTRKVEDEERNGPTERRKVIFGRDRTH